MLEALSLSWKEKLYRYSLRLNSGCTANESETGNQNDQSYACCATELQGAANLIGQFDVL